MSDYEFGNIESLKRVRSIEGETGTELGVGAGITLIVLAASDANPRWRNGQEDMQSELNRLKNARADGIRVRAFLSGEYSRRLVIGWYFTDTDGKRHEGPTDKGGHPIPFSADACKAFLMVADDAYAAVDAVVFDTKNFRGARIEAVVSKAGES